MVHVDSVFIINDITRKHSYPLLCIDNTLDPPIGVKWFSNLDLKSGHRQVQIDEQDKEKAAFTTGNGFWLLKVMPFRCPCYFQRLMDHVLSGLCPTIAMVSVPGEIFGTYNQSNWSSYESCEGKNNRVNSRNILEVRSFMDIALIIIEISLILRPFHQLTEELEIFDWTSDTEATFRSLTQAPSYTPSSGLPTKNYFSQTPSWAEHSYCY